MTAPVPVPLVAAVSASGLVARTLLALAVIVAAAWAGAELLRRVRQPGVVGEILAGVVLGPTVLGAVWPDAMAWLFPEDVRGLLAVVAQVGLVLFMFLVGAELDLGQVRGHGPRAAAVSWAGILLPLVLGVGLGVVVHPTMGGDAEVGGFALFLGVAMAITAFPVLASILREVGLLARPIGVLAMTCAAVDDVTAWVLLATVVAVVEATGAGGVALTAALLVGWLAVAWLVVRPALAAVPRLPLPLCLAWALGSAWITEVVGVHAIFGAFIAGAVLPRGERRPDVERIEPLTVGLLLPVFFVVAGLSTRFALLDSPEALAVLAAVLVVAVVGKLGGVYLAARVTGMDHVESLGLGLMMNTRGLTELVVLTIGLELGVIGERVFSIMVLMALVTTLMARPLLDVLRARGLGATAGP